MVWKNVITATRKDEIEMEQLQQSKLESWYKPSF